MQFLRSFGIFFLYLFMAPVFAQTNKGAVQASPKVVHHDFFSNIYLKNNRTSPVTLYGLYIRQFSYVSAGASCDEAIPFYEADVNAAIGSFVMSTTINAGQSAPISGNYLYNMIYSTQYYVSINSIAVPQKCVLPGCTSGQDTTLYNWCIHLGVLAPVTTSEGYTAKVPPVAHGVSGEGYDYNFISDYEELGPISCNDQLLTCTVPVPQTQPFS